jgi:hypothetical protein
MAIINELLGLGMGNLIRTDHNHITNSVRNTVYKSVITNMGMVRNFEVTFDIFNVHRICI